MVVFVYLFYYFKKRGVGEFVGILIFLSQKLELVSIIGRVGLPLKSRLLYCKYSPFLKHRPATWSLISFTVSLFNFMFIISIFLSGTYQMGELFVWLT